MTWFRVDDSFSDHAKVVALLEMRCGLRAVGLWTLCGSWTAKHERDGFVPGVMVKRFGATRTEANALVEVGLWVAEGDGYRFYGWEERNPLKSALDERRNSVADRQRRHRAKVSNALPMDDVTRDMNVAQRDVTLSQTLPVPDPSQTLPVRETERAPDGRFPALKTQIRQAFAAAFERHEGSLWTQANDPGLDTFTAWALSPSLPDPFAAAQQAMANFFADPYCKKQHYPIAHLAKYPQKYHSPRELEADVPETVESLRKLGLAALMRGDQAEVSKVSKRIDALESRADSQVRRAR